MNVCTICNQRIAINGGDECEVCSLWKKVNKLEHQLKAANSNILFLLEFAPYDGPDRSPLREYITAYSEQELTDRRFRINSIRKDSERKVVTNEV